ncbi:MAG: hypothetical protein CM15mP92_2120 [Halieaceae bacterium]|nr:MAG: hypothetical protein CM15mP92_2120 [Halieaceae bacterium]
MAEKVIIKEVRPGGSAQPKHPFKQRIALWGPRDRRPEEGVLLLPKAVPQMGGRECPQLPPQVFTVRWCPT